MRWPRSATGPSSILEQINLLPRRDVPAGVLTYAEQRALEIGITIAAAPTSSCSTSRPPA